MFFDILEKGIMERKAKAFDGEANKLSYPCVSERKCNINAKSYYTN